VAAEILFAPAALEDLESIFLYVAEAAGLDVAESYQSRIRIACLALADFPGRGPPRDDLAAGLRTITFERRALIAYMVRGNSVRILRILHGGRDLGMAFEET
jgi:toxin ParE1/3/4